MTDDERRALWQRCLDLFTDEEIHELLSLIVEWRDGQSTIVSARPEPPHMRVVR